MKMERLLFVMRLMEFLGIVILWSSLGKLLVVLGIKKSDALILSAVITLIVWIVIDVVNSYRFRNKMDKRK